MELFSLLAKLTLDSSEYTKGLNSAQGEADSFSGPEDQVLSIDTSGFEGDLQTAGDKASQFKGPEEQKLDLDNNDFNTDIEDSEKLSAGFGENVEGVFKHLKTAIVTTGLVSAVTGIANKLKEAVDMTAETADGIDKGASRLNMTRKQYQELDHALKQSGASINDLSKGVLLLNKHLAGEESKDITDVFDKLEISTKKANGELKTSAELIEEALVALAGKPNDADRVDLVTKLFGRGGTSLNALLDQGTEGVKALLEEADKLGLIMSDEEIDNAVAYGDAVSNLNEELAAIQSAFVADILPVLKDAVNWLTQFLANLNPRVQSNGILDTLSEINGRAKVASDNVDTANAQAKVLIEKLSEMGDYWKLDSEGRMTWDALAAKAIELFPELTNFIDINGKSIQGNTEDIEDNIDAWSRLQKQRILSEAMEEETAAVEAQKVEAYKKGAQASMAEAEAAGKQEKAIKELNDVLSKNAELRSFVQGNFGVTQVDASNAAEIFKYLNDRDFELPMGAETVEEWQKTEEEAKRLREESDKLLAEAEQAEADLLEMQKYLAQTMDLTDEEFRKTKAETHGEQQYTPFKKVDQVRLLAEDRAAGGNRLTIDSPGLNLFSGVGKDSAGTMDADLKEQIISAIKEGMEGATVNSYLDGKKVTEEVKRRITNDLYAGRYVP